MGLSEGARCDQRRRYNHSPGTCDGAFVLFDLSHKLIFSKATLPVDVKLAKVDTTLVDEAKVLTWSFLDDDFGSNLSLFGTYPHSGSLSLIQATFLEPDG